MLSYFSTSYLQYFLQSDLYFFWVCIFSFVANWFKIWSSGDVTCIAWFQSWPPGCVTCIATLPWNALLALSVSIELVSSSARVTSVKSQQRSRREWRTSGPKDRTPGLPGSDKNYCDQTKSAMYFIFVLSYKLDCVLNISQAKCNQNIFLKAQYNFCPTPLSEGHPG